MNKYAIVIPTSKGYMPGTNATLNALDYYEFKNTDVFILYGFDYLELGDEYLSSVKRFYPNVTFINLNDDNYFKWGNRDVSLKPKGFYFKFCDCKFAIDNLKNYDSVSLWGADLIPLNNFEIYFEIASKADKVILAHNEHAIVENSRLGTVWPYKHGWGVKYADAPFILPPNKFDLLELTLGFQFKERSTLSKMDGMNYAIRDLKYEEKGYILEVPGTLWVYNVPMWSRLTEGGKYIYFCKQRMNSFHRKYWSAQRARKYAASFPQNNKCSFYNIHLFNKKLLFFNKKWKTIWNDNLEVFDGKEN